MLLLLLPVSSALRTPRLARSPAAQMSASRFALLFDCDGVLADTERDGHRVSFNRVFEEKQLGFEWEVEEYGRLCEIGGGYALPCCPSRLDCCPSIPWSPYFETGRSG